MVRSQLGPRAHRQRANRGETPIPLDDTLAEALKITPADLIQPTHWPNIDLIGAQLNLYWAEFQIPVWRMQARSWKLWDALTDRLEADGVLDQYDLIFLDTPPACSTPGVGNCVGPGTTRKSYLFTTTT